MSKNNNDNPKLESGEKIFSVFLLIVAIGFFIPALKMYLDNPSTTSYGAMPLFLSSAIIILQIKTIITDWSKKSSVTDLNIINKLKKILNYLFMKNVTIMIILSLLYLVALNFNIGFILSSTIFLMIALTIFTEKSDYKKNILYTIITMISIIVLFKWVFQVVFP